MKTMVENLRYALLLCLIGICVACSDPMSQEEKNYLLEQAEKGNAGAQYKVFSSRRDFKNVFDDKTRETYFKRALEQGYEPAVYHHIYEAQKDNNAAKELKWLRYGVEHHSGRAMYDLASMYMEGTKVPENMKYARELLEKATALGNTNARNKLRELDGTQPGFLKRLGESFVDEFNSSSGSFLGRVYSTWFEGSKGLLIGGFMPIFLDVGYPWWQGILLLLGCLGFVILFFVLASWGASVEKSNSKGRLRLTWIPWAFALYGAILGVTGRACSEIYYNVGRLTAAEGTFGNWTMVSTVQTWLMLFIILYGVIVVCTSSRSPLSLVKRLLFLSVMSVYGFFVGVSLALVFAIVLALSLFKGSVGSFFVSENDGSSGGTSNGPAETKVDCRYKTISGGCSLNNGWSCHVEQGADGCPYGGREM